MIPVGLLHDLHPLDLDSVLGGVLLCFELRQLSDFLERKYAEAPVDVELKVLLDFVAALLENFFAECTGVVGNFRFKLDRVLVDTSNVLLVKIDREVVTEQF